MVELLLDRGQVRKDVAVVELEVVQHDRARPVMDELRPLVEEGRVVLVGLDHEELRIGEPRRYREVMRDTAHEEARVQAGLLEDERQHRRGGGLAMRAGNRLHPLAAQHLLGQPLRPGHVRQAAVEDLLHQCVAARHHVADHEYIGLQADLRGLEALDQLDALLRELGAHRRIDIGIAAGHAMAGLAGEDGNPAHESTADPEDMYMHGTRSVDERPENRRLHRRRAIHARTAGAGR